MLSSFCRLVLSMCLVSVKSGVGEKATSIPVAGAPKARRSARRGVRCPSGRAPYRARPSRCACGAGTGFSPGRTPASAFSCRVAVLVVVVVVVRGAALAHVLALVGGEPVVERLQADAEHVGRLPLRAALGERRLDQPPAHLFERA